MPSNSAKAGQRERILDGMLTATNRNGYAGANVSAVIDRAGVSRPTFYEYFIDKEDCFLALHREISRRLVEHVEHAVAEAAPERAPQAAAGAMIGWAEANPDQAGLLAGEAMAGGSSTMDERDRTIAEIEAIVEAARAALDPQVLSPDLPTRALIGGVDWLLVPRLRRGEGDFKTLLEELEGWIASFNQPMGAHRWRRLEPSPMPLPSPFKSELSPTPPAPIPSGRSRMSRSEVAENQRLRIMFASAEVALHKSYSAATVSDIIRAGRVDKRVFYKHFRDKQDAFGALHELGFQQTIAVTASAYFSAEGWPERIWAAMLAGNQFLASYPTLCRIAFIVPHAIGAPARARIEESQAAFKIFLLEGNQEASKPQTAVTSEAVSSAIFEIGYLQFRREKGAQLPHFVAHAVYLCLAPVLGPDSANRFIDGKLHGADATES